MADVNLGGTYLLSLPDKQKLTDAFNYHLPIGMSSHTSIKKVIMFRCVKINTDRERASENFVQQSFHCLSLGRNESLVISGCCFVFNVTKINIFRFVFCVNIFRS